MREEQKSAGHGDGSDADEFGVYRCSHWPNTTHPHLGGDFIRRDAAGDTIIMSLEKYQVLRLDLLDSRTRVKELEDLCRIADARFFAYERRIKESEWEIQRLLSEIVSLRGEER